MESKAVMKPESDENDEIIEWKSQGKEEIQWNAKWHAM